MDDPRSGRALMNDGAIPIRQASGPTITTCWAVMLEVLARERRATKNMLSAKRTGLEIDDFYVEQAKRQGVRKREEKIPIGFVWSGIEGSRCEQWQPGRLPYNTKKSTPTERRGYKGGWGFD